MATSDPDELRKLRDATASIVMGWICREIDWAYDQRVRVWHDDVAPILTYHAWQPDDIDQQCMQVVDKMLERGYSCDLRLTLAQTSARFSRDGESRAEFAHTNKRIALLQAAVCSVR